MEIWRKRRPKKLLEERYRLRKFLGKGEIAEVWEGWDVLEQRYVAIKIVQPQNFDPQLQARFTQESGYGMWLKHPNILAYKGTYTLPDEARGFLSIHLIMEYISGGNLQERLASNTPYSFTEKINTFAQLCEAIDYVHKHNIVHGAIK